MNIILAVRALLRAYTAAEAEPFRVAEQFGLDAPHVHRVSPPRFTVESPDPQTRALA